MKILRNSGEEYLIGEGVIIGPLSCDVEEDGDIDAEVEAMRLYLEGDLPKWKTIVVKLVEAFDELDYAAWTRVVKFAFLIEKGTGWDSQPVVNLANGWKAIRQSVTDWLVLAVIH